MRKTLKKNRGNNNNNNFDSSNSKCDCCNKELHLVCIEIYGKNYCSRECLKTIGVVNCNTCEKYNKKENMFYIKEKDAYCCKGKCANLNEYAECCLCLNYKSESTLIIKDDKYYCLSCKIKLKSKKIIEEEEESIDENDLKNTDFNTRNNINLKNIINESYGEESQLVNYIIKEDKKYINYLNTTDKERLERLLERYSLIKEKGFLNLGFEPLYLYDKKVKNVFKLIKDNITYLLSISVLFFINSSGQLKEIHNLNKFDSLDNLINLSSNNNLSEIELYIDIHNFRNRK